MISQLPKLKMLDFQKVKESERQAAARLHPAGSKAPASTVATFDPDEELKQVRLSCSMLASANLTSTHLLIPKFVPPSCAGGGQFAGTGPAARGKAEQRTHAGAADGDQGSHRRGLDAGGGAKIGAGLDHRPASLAIGRLGSHGRGLASFLNVYSVTLTRQRQVDATHKYIDWLAQAQCEPTYLGQPVPRQVQGKSPSNKAARDPEFRSEQSQMSAVEPPAARVANAKPRSHYPVIFCLYNIRPDMPPRGRKAALAAVPEEAELADAGAEEAGIATPPLPPELLRDYNSIETQCM